VIAGLLLAAGGGRRFGSQKLLALMDGEPIVRRAALVLGSATDMMTAVVGSEARRVSEALAGVSARIVVNDDWAAGLASSLRAGAASLDPSVAAVVVALGDQPTIDRSVVDRVIAEWRARGRPIVAARYRGEQGHPVLFARAVFGELAELSGDRGAKAVVGRDPGRLAYVEVDAPMPRDIDTRDDLGMLGARDRLAASE
jgi:molybdenum cofactor cytidylyltransferase